MEINQKAFSSDGYLINQRLLRGIPYGIRQSDYNGCGWIAAYNFLRACGRKKDWNTVRQQLEEGLILGGLLGTHLFQLYRYLHKHGFSIHWAFGKKNAVKKGCDCRAGILFYCNGAALHFVAFTPVKEEEQTETSPQMPEDSTQPYYRFFNGRMGKQNDCDTMTHFLDTESVLPIVIQLTT